MAQTTGNTSLSTALNNKLNPNPLGTQAVPDWAKNIASGFRLNAQGGLAQGLGNTPLIPGSAPKPSTPIKSQTVAPDGTHTVTYHAPAKTDTTTPATSQNAPGTTGTPAPAPTTGIWTTPTGATVDTQTGLVKTPAPVTAPSFPSTVSGITDIAKGNLPIGQSAADIAASYGQRIADVGQQAAKAQAGYLTTGTTPVAEGGAAVIAQTAAEQQKALATGEQAALMGTGQQLTAEQQAQTGLTAAGGLTKPELGAYGQTYYSPIGGGTIGQGQGGAFDSAMNTYIQMAANGQYGAIPSTITGNPVLNAEVIQGAQKANPSFDPVTSGAKGASAVELTKQGSAVQSQANGAEANFNLMLDIAQKGGVNDMNVPILNTLQQNVQRGLTSSAAVTNFQSLIQSVRSQYASILGGGTVTVEALQEAQSLIPQDISITALQALGQNLKKDAQNRVTGINEQIKTLTGRGGASTSGAKTTTPITSNTVW